MPPQIDFSKYEEKPTGKQIDFSQYDNLPHEAPPNLSDPFTGRDVAIGAGKGALNTLTGLSGPIHNIPVVGEKLIPGYTLDRLKELKTPTNTAQKVGYYGEQGAEYLLPSIGLEEKAGALAAEHAPAIIGNLAPRAAKIGAAALEAGAHNKLQGGSFKEGAEGGAIGAGAGEVMRAAAPSVMESALEIPKRMRGYGKTPGLAALEETQGILPSTIEESARKKLATIGPEINSLAASHPGTVSLKPALSVIGNRASKAVEENTPGIHADLGGMRDLLTKEFQSGIPIPEDVPATKALSLKRGLRSQYVKNWNPEVHAEIPGLAKSASGAIDRELDRTIGPKFSELNQRYSSLQPVAERAESIGRDPGIAQRVGRRLAAHTGALTGAIGGGIYGHEKYGTPGAAIGAGIGLVAPEIISSSPAEAWIARRMYSPVVPRALVGTGLQVSREQEEDRQ